MITIMTDNELPDWLQYPPEYIRIVQQNLINLDPWVIMDKEMVKSRKEGLEQRYPERVLFPFARCWDRDDVACWDKDRPGQVVLIHDFSSSDYLVRKHYNNFWEWFRNAIEDMIEYEP